MNRRSTRRNRKPHGQQRAMGHPRVHRMTPADLVGPSPLLFTPEVLADIRRTIGARPAEAGGMLGGRRGSDTIDHFQFDDSATTTDATYYPDSATVNRFLKQNWNPRGINLLGFVHSHPRGSDRPSAQDVAYSARILQAIPELPRFLLPIVQAKPDGGKFRVAGYCVERANAAPSDVVLRAAPVETAIAQASHPEQHPAFSRVVDAYDISALAHGRIVAVGCGGSAQFLEDMARAGIGEFVLIDPDHVDAPNIGTQQTFLSDLGRPKVQGIAERIVDVSPHARVYTLRCGLDELDDHAMDRLCHSGLQGHPASTATLLCAFTDSFPAQARVNRLGLHLGVATIAATVYWQGRGIEMAFTAPGVTAACLRCVLGSRYRAYLDEGYRNDVTSHGTPLWATARLNALKQPLALALLHAMSSETDPDHPGARRHQRLLNTVADRNLVQVSLDPEIDSTLGLKLFRSIASADPAGRLPLDTTAWLQQTPENPDHGFAPCADCGGTGDLTASFGSFRDTRVMPHAYADRRTAAPATA